MGCPNVDNPITHALQDTPGDEAEGWTLSFRALSDRLDLVEALQPGDPVAEPMVRGAMANAERIFHNLNTRRCPCKLMDWLLNVRQTLRTQCTRLNLVPDHVVPKNWERM